jgi:hypothetical protein
MHAAAFKEAQIIRWVRYTINQSFYIVSEMGAGSSAGPKIEGKSMIFEMFSPQSVECFDLSRGNTKNNRDKLKG